MTRLAHTHIDNMEIFGGNSIACMCVGRWGEGAEKTTLLVLKLQPLLVVVVVVVMPVQKLFFGFLEDKWHFVCEHLTLIQGQCTRAGQKATEIQDNNTIDKKQQNSTAPPKKMAKVV